MFDLKGKNIVVTGSSAGIGKAIAIALAQQGANVVVSDLNEDKGKEISKQIEKMGVKSFFVKADVSDVDQVKNLINTTVKTWGSIDCAVNNAGIAMIHTPFHEVEEKTLDKVVDVNLKGVFYCMKYEIDEMLKQGQGAIVNIASIGGLRGTPGMCLYNATKHGVLGLTKSAAVEYAKNNIHINAICPGPTDTGLIPDEFKPQMVKDIPAGKLVQPEQIANLAVFLCSDESSMLIGDAIAADNGMITLAR